MKQHKLELPLDFSDPFLQPYFNRLYLMKSDYAMNLVGNEEIPSRSNVFYVSNLSSAIQTSDLVATFGNYAQVIHHQLDFLEPKLFFFFFLKGIICSMD